jgi:putative DNA primase/helicase
LDKVQLDKSVHDVLAEYLAYIFAKHLKLEKALILFGSGANGKSVFFDIVSALVGKENTTNFSLQSLTDEKGYSRAKITDALVNYASEINGKLESNIFKLLVSGEPVEARLPYKEPFTITDYARLIFNCNELPKDIEHTHAYFRRFLIIPFDVTIPKNEQDKELSNKIINNELSGVFNWVLEGLNRILELKKFSECESSDKVLIQFEKESDTTQLFLEELGYQKSITELVKVKDLYNEYRYYCVDNGYRSLNSLNFKKRLERLNYDLKRQCSGFYFYLEQKVEIEESGK